MAFTAAVLAQVKAGACYGCGDPRGQEGTKTYCRKCADTLRIRNQLRRKTRAEAKFCTRCGQPADGDQCGSCNGKTSAHRRALKRERIGKGICVECDGPSVQRNTRCEKHIVAQAASSIFGKRSMAEALWLKFEAQGRRCHYTGLPIAIGVDASIDHVLPKATRPDLAESLDNLVWCHRRLNLCKRDLTGDEFIQLCRMVVRHAGTA